MECENARLGMVIISNIEVSEDEIALKKEAIAQYAVSSFSLTRTLTRDSVQRLFTATGRSVSNDKYISGPLRPSFEEVEASSVRRFRFFVEILLIPSVKSGFRPRSLPRPCRRRHAHRRARPLPRLGNLAGTPRSCARDAGVPLQPVFDGHRVSRGLWARTAEEEALRARGGDLARSVHDQEPKGGCRGTTADQRAQEGEGGDRGKEGEAAFDEGAWVR